MKNYYVIFLLTKLNHDDDSQETLLHGKEGQVSLNFSR